MRYDIVLFIPPERFRQWKRCLKKLNGILIENGLRSTTMPIMSWTPNVSCAISFGLGGSKPSTKRGRIIGALMKHQRQSGDRHIVYDLGYIHNRPEYWSVCWNDLNGRGDFCNENMDDKRVKEWGIELQPWRCVDDGYVLFCLQLPWDAAVINTNYIKYVESTVEEMLSKTNRKIVIREHPLLRKKKDKRAVKLIRLVNKISKKDRVSISKTKKLTDDLEGAWCVVSCNSNSTVEAAIYGVPSFVSDIGSMSWDVSGHDLDIENPIRPERNQWLYNLSYAQWTMDEISKGYPFKQLGVI